MNLIVLFSLLSVITGWLLIEYRNSQLDLAIDDYFRDTTRDALKLETKFEKEVTEIQNFIIKNLDPVIKKIQKTVPENWYRKLPVISKLSTKNINAHWNDEYIRQFSNRLKQRHLFRLKSFRDKILKKFPQLNDQNMSVEYLDLHLFWQLFKAYADYERRGRVGTLTTNRLTIPINPVDSGLATSLISKIFVDLMAKHMMGNQRIRHYFINPFADIIGIQFDPSNKSFQSISIYNMNAELMLLGVAMSKKSQEFLLRKDVLDNLPPDERYQGFITCGLSLKPLLLSSMKKLKKVLEYDATSKQDLLNSDLSKYSTFFKLDPITHEKLEQIQPFQLNTAIEKSMGNLKLLAIDANKKLHFINLIRESRYNSLIQIFQTPRAKLLRHTQQTITNILMTFGSLLLLVILVTTLFAKNLTETLRNLASQVQAASSNLQSSELSSLKTSITELLILRSVFVQQIDQLRREFELSTKLTNFQEFLIKRPMQSEILNYLEPIYNDCYDESARERLENIFDFRNQNLNSANTDSDEFHWEWQRYDDSLKLESDFRRATQQKKEFELAQRMQAQLLPSDELFDDNNYFYYLAARYLGGDFYDLLRLDNKTFYLIADVSGKGLPSALFGSATKFFLASQLRASPDLEVAMQRTNNYLCGLQQQGFFCTLFLASWDPESRVLEYCSAGHNKMYLVTPELLELNGKGLPLGFLDMATYSVGKLENIPLNSLLALYTDGVTEAENINLELYDNYRLEKLLTDNSNRPVTMISEALLKSLTEFTEGAEQSDDITYLLARL